jgi:class 3 adenylate cyclase
MEQETEASQDRINDALARGAWPEVFDLLLARETAGTLDADDRPMLAVAAYVAGAPEVAVRTWEHAYANATAAGDEEQAAEAGIHIAFLLLDAGLMAELRGWLARIERLLPSLPESTVHAGFEVVQAFRSLWAGDHEASLEHARRAVELGTRFGDRSTVAFARSAEGRALILLGHVDEGLGLLDEVALAASSGELDPITTGAVYCAAVCAFQAVADYERAAEWTAAMERWQGEFAIGNFHGRCRVHRAEILRLRGAHAEAEEQARIATEEGRVYLRGELGWPLTELGRIRLRTGDLDGAERAFLEAHALGWDPQPELALLHLARGDVQGAAAQIRHALEHPSNAPSQENPPNSVFRRAPLLAAQTEIALAAGDVDRARWAAGELDGIARNAGTTALRAGAEVASGAVAFAEGESDRARELLLEGASLWGRLDAPFEAARARTLLADAHFAAGDSEHGALELQTARRAFQRIGATLEVRRTERALADRGKAERTGPAADQVLMFTDIVGSTALLEVVGDEAWADLIRWHDAVLRDTFAAHGGTEVDHTGDGFFVSFDDAEPAVRCAVAVQRRLAEHRREHGFAPQVRIGLHAAEARWVGSSVRGLGVHLAARISALAGPGEIVASRPTLEAAGREPGPGDVRIVTVKGISNPVEVATVRWQDDG